MSAREQLTGDAPSPRPRDVRAFPARPQGGEGQAVQGRTECGVRIARERGRTPKCAAHRRPACAPRGRPDVPFESIQLTVPQGPFSEFGVNLPHGSQNFCGQKLTMPILFKAQNGQEIHQSVPVAVTGCPKTLALTHSQKLAGALKACRRKHAGKRAACENAACLTYGPKKARKAGKATSTGRHR